MSRLSELVAELCPDGVEYKALGDIGVFSRGSSFQKKDFVESGTPCIHYGQVHTRFSIATDHVVSYLDESFAAKKKGAKPGDLIIATTSEDDDAVGKAVAWLGDTDVVVSNDAYIYRHTCDPKYMAYVFASDLFQEPKRAFITGTKVRRLNDRSMSRIVIPVPPIEVQREVVRVLDEYTAAHDGLVRNLSLKIELYRSLLNVASEQMKSSGCAVGKLSDLVDMKAGKSIRSTEIVPQIDDEHPYPCYGGGALRGFVSRYSHDGQYSLIGRQGANCGQVNFVDGKFYATEHAVVCNPICEFDSTWLYFVLVGMDLNQYKTKSAQPGLSVKRIKDLPIGIPTLPDQKLFGEHVGMLQSVSNDIIDTCSREILFENEQLSLLRNRLLSYPEKVS